MFIGIVYIEYVCIYLVKIAFFCFRFEVVLGTPTWISLHLINILVFLSIALRKILFQTL